MLRKGERPVLFAITTKLKRYKYLLYVSKVLLIPLNVVVIALVKLGEIAETVLEILDDLLHNSLILLVVKFNWNEEAEKQYQENPKKFKL